MYDLAFKNADLMIIVTKTNKQQTDILGTVSLIQVGDVAYLYDTILIRIIYKKAINPS